MIDQVQIMACRPVVPNEIERRLELEIGQSIATPYEGSVKGTCPDCNREVWIGPRQQDMLAHLGPESIVTCCLPCAAFRAQTLAKQEDGPELINLGNPEKFYPEKGV